MRIQLIGLQRVRAYRGDFDEPKAWESPACLLTFSLYGCSSSLPDVIDAVENMEGLALEQCIREDDRYVIAVSAAGEQRRRAVETMGQLLGVPMEKPYVDPEDGLCIVDDGARNALVVFNDIQWSLKRVGEIGVNTTQVKEAWLVISIEADEQTVVAVSASFPTRARSKQR